MDQYADAGRGKWCSIKVEQSMELRVGRQLGIESGATEEVQRQLGLGEKFIPKVEWEILVNAAKSSNKVVFERANGTFCSVAAVQTGRDELIIDVFRGEKLLQGG